MLSRGVGGKIEVFPLLSGVIEVFPITPEAAPVKALPVF
jgi:hypothetical protein